MIHWMTDNLYDGDSKRVYVNNLSWSVRWQDLKDHMRDAGHGTRAEVCFNKHNILYDSSFSYCCHFIHIKSIVMSIFSGDDGIG